MLVLWLDVISISQRFPYQNVRCEWQKGPIFQNKQLPIGFQITMPYCVWCGKLIYYTHILWSMTHQNTGDDCLLFDIGRYIFLVTTGRSTWGHSKMEIRYSLPFPACWQTGGCVCQYLLIVLSSYWTLLKRTFVKWTSFTAQTASFDRFQQCHQSNVGMIHLLAFSTSSNLLLGSKDLALIHYLSSAGGTVQIAPCCEDA